MEVYKIENGHIHLKVVDLLQSNIILCTRTASIALCGYYMDLYINMNAMNVTSDIQVIKTMATIEFRLITNNPVTNSQQQSTEMIQ